MKLDRNKFSEEYKVIEIPEFFFTASLHLEASDFKDAWIALFEKLFNGVDHECESDLGQMFLGLTMHYYTEGDQ